MEIGILGPVRARVGGKPVDLRRRQLRLLLALLAIHADDVVSTDRITGVLWDTEPPRGHHNQIQVLVRGLRRLAAGGDHGDGLIETRPGIGYRLCAPPATVDLQRFESGMSAAERMVTVGRLDAAGNALAEALRIWRGPALQGLPGRFAAAQSAVLEERRLVALQRWIDVRLALGQFPDLVPGLTGLVRTRPLHEGFRGRLMVALYGSDRAVEGLSTYLDGLDLLREEHGADPGERLRAVHQMILRREPIGHIVARLTGISASARLSSSAGTEFEAKPPTPRQLPAGLAAFTGRTTTLKQLDALLAAHDRSGGAAVPVIAVVGAPGIGKTTLAVRWAHEIAHRFPDGQLYLDLRGYDADPPMEPAQALLTCLRALGVAPERLPTDLDDAINWYRSLLADKRLLVVLDNARGPEHVRPLLPGGPGCLVLVTSRDRLDGLRVKDGARSVTVAGMTLPEACALLENVIGGQRLRAEPAATARLVELCGGLPLALRIAAEVVMSRPRLTIADLAAELAGGRSGLDTLATVDDDPAGAVRSVFSWSLRELPAEVTRLFRLLGLSRGTDISAAAAAALAAITTPPARRRLERLRCAHLVEQTGPDRYRMHDLLRRYAAETVEAQEPESERKAAVERLLGWYLSYCDSADRLLLPRQMHTPMDIDGGICARQTETMTRDEALRWTQAEHANLVAAVKQSAETGAWDVAWRLPAAMWGHLYLRKPWDDWIACYRIGLDAAGRTRNGYGQAWMCNGLGVAHWGRHEFAQALEYYRQALRHWVKLGNPWGTAMTLNNLGATYCGMTRYDEGMAHFQRALAIRVKLDDRHGQAQTLTNLGEVNRQTGRLTEALRHCREAIELFRSLDKPFGEATAMHNLASVHHELGQFDEAIDLYRGSLATRTRLGDLQGQAETLFRLGESLDASGHAAAARGHRQQALTIFEDLGDPQADTLIGGRT